MKTILSFLLIIIFFTVELTANNSIQDIAIENVEFPQLVALGDIAIFKCDIINTDTLPITLDFDLNFNITTTNNDYSEIDETEIIENETLEPGERKSVERPIYINNARAASNANNLIAIWPSGRSGNEERGAATETDFYVEAEEELERGEEEIINECAIEIIFENNQVVINGLSSEFEATVIDQDGIINYFCTGDCPSDEVIVDLPDSGFFFVQVRSLIDQQCISFNSIVVGDWSSYQLEYDLNEIFYIPPGAFYDFESAIQQEIDELQKQIDSIQFQIDTLQPQIDTLLQNIEITELQIDSLNAQLLEGVNYALQQQVNYLTVGVNNYQSMVNYLQSGINYYESGKDYYLAGIEYLQSIIDELNTMTTDPDCVYDELDFLPQVGNILETSVLVSIPILYKNINFEIKESDLDVWTPLTFDNGFAILNQLKSCTKYDIRNTYSCNIGKIVSDVITFETNGCDNLCNGETTQLYALASFNNSIVLNWDVVPGKTYQLKYKAASEDVWNTHSTVFSFAYLFGLDACSTYEFSVSVVCEADFLSVESNTIALETGNCKLGSGFLEDEDLAVYPTIARDYIGVVANDTENISDLSIYDLAGNLVKTITPQIMTTSVSDLPSGSYIVIATTANSILSTKFMKQ